MYIWYISLYEPMPINVATTRMMRSGFISSHLHSRGHEVELWIPGFEHSLHVQFQKETIFVRSKNSFSIQYIESIGYRSDVSVRRWLADAMYARKLASLMNARKRIPDLIITQIPTLKMASVAVNFAKRNNIPIVVDIRDPWPDIYRRIFPRGLAWFYNIVFFTEIVRVKSILRNASAITAVSKTYLDWSSTYLPGFCLTPKQVFEIGYDEKLFNYHSHERYISRGRRSDELVAVYAGTFGRNIDIPLIRSLARIIHISKINIRLHIYGSGEGSEIIASIESEFPCVRFFGWKSADALPEIFMESDVGLVLYPKGAVNSLSNKFFEYLAASLPIVSTLSAEEPCQLLCKTHTGINCSPGDSSAVYSALCHYLKLKMDGRLEFEKINCRQVFEKFYGIAGLYERFSLFVERVVGPE